MTVQRAQSNIIFIHFRIFLCSWRATVPIHGDGTTDTHLLLRRWNELKGWGCHGWRSLTEAAEGQRRERGERGAEVTERDRGGEDDRKRWRGEVDARYPAGRKKDTRVDVLASTRVLFVASIILLLYALVVYIYHTT